MHLKIVRVSRKDKRYQYGQLVQSVRRVSDGKTTTKVIASLGAMTDLEIQNFRQALRATKTGQRVIVAPLTPPKVLRNLRYLDVAVALEMWRSLGLGELLAQIAPSDNADVAWQDVVAALVVQRCIEPGSKLFAQRWFPTTCLPMTLELPTAKFNNSRLHRVLNSLAQVDDQLQELVACRIVRESGADKPFAALFLDATDTWFVGSGPQSAHRARTKEGLVRQRIGIALLCQEHGLPMRWSTFPGNQHEARPMLDIVQATAGLAWTRGVPLIVDRGLGSAAHVAEMLDANVRFVTAAPRSEIPVYLGDALADIAALSEVTPKAGLDEVERIIEAAGFRRVNGKTYLRDFGLKSRPRTRPRTHVSHSSYVMSLVARFDDDIVSGRATTSRALAKLHGCSSSHAKRLVRLHALPKEMRQAVIDGATPAAKFQELLALVEMAEPERREAFARLKIRTGFRAAQIIGRLDEPDLTVRVVAYFNPEQFAVQRRHANALTVEVSREIASLNTRLRVTPKRSKASIFATVGALLKKRSAVTLFDVAIEKVNDGGDEFSEVRATLDDKEWARRRRLDGLAVTLTHPDLKRSPEELVALYRAKEAVERDFREIKSVLELRPVHHRKDSKVQAHVTLCVLALLLERTLERRLANAGLPMTAVAAFEALKTCHLNEIATDEREIYTITSPTDTQRAIVQALGLSALLNPVTTFDPKR